LPDCLGYSNSVFYSEVEENYHDKQIIFRSIKIKISFERPAYKPKIFKRYDYF